MRRHVQPLQRLADDGRRGHGADRDRRRLPRLQREQRAAVRPGLPGLGRGPERGAAGQQQRGPDRRPAGRRGRVDRAGRDRLRADDGASDRTSPPRRPTSRRDRRPAQPEARQDAPSRCPRTRSSGFATSRRSGSSTWRSCAAPGTPAPEGYVFDGTDDGGICTLPADDEAAAEPSARGDDRERLLPGADRVRRHQQHLRHPDPRERPRRTWSATATRFAARGVSLNQAIENLRPCSAT